MTRNEILFVIILMNMFFGSFSPMLTIVSLCITIICSVIIGIQYANEHNYCICKWIIILLMFQNLCIGCGAHLLGNSSDTLKYITQIPFITIAISWIILQIKIFFGSIKEDNSKKFFILWLIIVLSSLIFGHGNIQSILINLRNMMVFYMAYELGKYNIRDRRDFYLIVKLIILISFIFLVAGIIILFGGYRIYNFLGFNEVYIAKGQGYLGRLDSRFYTIIITRKVLRMGSLLYEPVNLAYFYALSFILTRFIKWKKSINKIFFSLICGLGLLLTFGKGGYLIVIAYYLFFILDEIFANSNKVKKFSIRKHKKIIILGLIILTVFSIFYYKKIGATTKQHFWGIIGTWDSVINKPLGYGLGTGGNAAKKFNEDFSSTDWLKTGGETALMSFMYQVGIHGILFLILTMINMHYKVDKKNINLNRDKIFNLYYYMPIILLGLSILQDNTFSPQCIVPFMLVQGAIYSICKFDVNNNKKF